MKKWPPRALATFVVILYFGTFILFFFATEYIDYSPPALYWALKYAYILIGVSICIFLTTFWEEYVVVSLAKKEGSLLIPALKANLIDFIIILAFLAAKALPERMKSPNYLIENENQTTVAQVDQPRYSAIDESTRTIPEFE